MARGGTLIAEYKWQTGGRLAFHRWWEIQNTWNVVLERKPAPWRFRSSTLCANQRPQDVFPVPVRDALNGGGWHAMEWHIIPQQRQRDGPA